MLSNLFISTKYPVIGDPLASGAVQLIMILSSMNTVVGVVGLSGIYAARIYTGSEFSPRPTLFLAVTINL